jgi:hypothetical protein
MARKKKITTKDGATGGVKVTLTKDYVYPNGMILRAGKSPIVAGYFADELKAGGYLDKQQSNPKD